MAKKRLVFCTYPSLYSSLVFKKLLADDDIDVVALISSNRVLNKKYGSMRAALKQIRLCGWRYSSYLFLVTDLFTILSNLLPGREKLPGVAKLAKKQGIPVLKTSDINDPAVCDYIVSKKPEFLLAAHFNQLIKPAVLELPGLSCLNIHPSMLPDYKGVDPVFYALLDNKQAIGVTVHKMAERFDSGNILSQQSFPVRQTAKDLFSHNCTLFSAGAELAINMIKQQPMSTGIPQIQGQGRYDSWPDSGVVKLLRSKNNHKLISLRNYFGQIFSGQS